MQNAHFKIFCLLVNLVYMWRFLVYFFLRSPMMFYDEDSKMLFVALKVGENNPEIALQLKLCIYLFMRLQSSSPD